MQSKGAVAGRQGLPRVGKRVRGAMLIAAALWCALYPSVPSSAAANANAGKERAAKSRAPGSGGVISVDKLRRQIMDAIAAARLGSGRIGISIRDCASLNELIVIQPDTTDRRQFIPASNLKLLTSGVALLALGSDYEFRTSIVLQGNRLIIRGSGDPAMADPALLEELGISTEQFVNTLVNSITNAGAMRVDEVILDDRVFDRVNVHPDWPADQLSRAYCAPVSGLNFHANILNVFASPATRVGDPPVIRTDPAATWIEVDRKNARTVAQGNTQIWIQHGATALKFLVHGSVRAAIREPVQVTLKDPGLLFGKLLADGLLKQNVGGKPGTDGRPTMPLVRYAEASENLTVPAGLERTVAVVRTPIAVVLERCNVDSDNLYAESLLKAAAHKLTGQPGSWSNGTAAVRMLIKDRLGADAAATVVMADGSGLSRNNRITVSLMTRWLAEVANDPKAGSTYIESLAVAGSEGTVKSRFKKSKLDCEVRAKSGYIREVRTLSGYLIEGSTDRRIAFSVMVNDVPPGADQRAKDLHERIVELIDSYVASQATRPQGTLEALGH